MPRYRRRDGPPVDFLNNVIEVGDSYFYGSPPTLGKVLKITGSTIVIEETITYANGEVKKHPMKCKSPEKGLCIDKT